MLSNHLILCRPLLLLPPISPSIRLVSSESALCIRWPKYWSISTSPSNECSGLISFRIDWFALLAVQGTQESSPAPQFESIHSSALSILYGPTLSLYMTTGKTIALTMQIFVGKVMSLLFNTLSRCVIAFLPRSKPLLISWLPSPSAVFLGPKKRKSVCIHLLSFYLPWSDGARCHDLNFLNVGFEANFFTLLFHFQQEAL